ncbi:MAG: HDIG domain-containing protein [Methanofollis sp.]|uniref:HDIG domain-containing metalloprotein n=1 Tax=Methanofollis sp. TaxID=2052835 RepID=UPI002603E6EC|nr:HDIG domain-containing metalloprotein [Methanofollis sp.]MDD4255973.1 HDIG domain-containing protein [Methanofollis sp.]
MQLLEQLEAHLSDAGCDPRVIAHCRTVNAVAAGYARSPVVDRELLIAGAMLHDLGRSETHSLHHAEVGADLARQTGCPDEVARIVQRHIGAGLTVEECALLGLIPRDSVPQRLEERIVAHADNLVKGTRVITSEERMDRSVTLGRKFRVRAVRLGLDLEPLRHLR